MKNHFSIILLAAVAFSIPSSAVDKPTVNVDSESKAAAASAPTEDSMTQKVNFHKRVEAEYHQLQKDVKDADHRIGFAPRPNRKKMKYLVKKLKDTLETVEPEMEGLRSAGESTWKSYQAKIEEALKDMHKDWAEVKTLMN